jgi:hypothetical protein
MNRSRSANVVVLGLAALALGQGFFLIRKGTTSAQDMVHGLQVGADLSALVAVRESGEPPDLSNGQPTLLLAFDSECSHSEAVTDLWRSLTESRHEELRIVLLSPEPLETAKTYAIAHGWSGEVWAVDSALTGSLGFALTQRTPWAFLLNGNGVLVSDGHGSEAMGMIGAPTHQTLGASG